MGLADQVGFVAYLVVLALIGWAAGRREERAEDYFLAGRRLPWWLIGASLLASNVSTEHFVGMAGAGARADVGLAIASYEWMAAVTLVVVARWFLPRFLAGRISTMPEFLERRFSPAARTWLALYMLVAYVFVALATVLYSGALAVEELFGLPLPLGILLLAAVGGGYTVWGGLRAVVWTDFLQAATLLAGGAFAAWLALDAVGGVAALRAATPERFHVVKPLSDPELPWFAVFFGGLWIANLFYWGCNQFITQRVLAARDLRQARRGVVFAAGLKLLVPFLIVVPGIAAAVLYEGRLESPDRAFPTLLGDLLPDGARGPMLAALLGAVLSSLDSMLNSAATIFSLDVWRRFRPDTPDHALMRVGRLSTFGILLVAVLWAPALGRFPGIFRYVQEFWGLVTPGVAVVFLAGLFTRRASAGGAVAALALTLPVTLGLKLGLAAAAIEVAFLDQMFLAALVLAVVLFALSPRRAAAPAGSESASATVGAASGPPCAAPERDPLFDVACAAVVAAVAALYWTFR